MKLNPLLSQLIDEYADACINHGAAKHDHGYTEAESETKEYALTLQDALKNRLIADLHVFNQIDKVFEVCAEAGYAIQEYGQANAAIETADTAMYEVEKLKQLIAEGE